MSRLLLTDGNVQNGKTNQAAFNGFGKSLITKAARKSLQGISIPAERLEARRELREFAPATPGIYGWLDQNQQLIYVGKSKSLRARLLSYFDKTPSDLKMQRIRENSRSIVWEATSHELLALLREQELIVNHRPPMNVQGQPTRRQPGFVCINESIAPKAYLARKLTDRTRNWFGPVSGTGELNRAILSLNYAFRLRDCADNIKFKFSDQLQLFDNQENAKCLRFELGTCPAPCAGACSARNYAERVSRAFEFLQGDDSILQTLESEMARYSKKRAFEKALVLRDQLDSLQWLSRRLAVLRQAEDLLNGVYEIPGLSRRPIWIWLRRGEIIGCHAKSTQIPKSVLNQLNQTGNPTNLIQSILNTYLKMIMVGWFRKHPQEKRYLLGISFVDEALEKAAKTDSSTGEKAVA